MLGRVNLDKRRFFDIVRKSVRKNLHKFITSDRFVLPDKSGRGKISIPLPRINIPRFKFEDRQLKGVGQGKGDKGDIIGWGDEEDGGQGQGAGDQIGDHALEEIEINEDDFFKILGEELELPRIEPKGRKTVESPRYAYKGIRRVGPESLRQFKRTYKEALKRQIASGSYDPQNPVVFPIKNDKRYRSLESKTSSEISAVIFHLIDVSGSIDDEQREIIRRITYCVNGWIERCYKGTKQRYIVHDFEAEEVIKHTFFHIDTSGGTKISSALSLMSEIIDKEYPAEEWNIYAFYYSDGDNWNDEDNLKCMRLIGDRILPKINLFCFGYLINEHMGSNPGFFKFLKAGFKKEKRIIISKIKDRDSIIGTIKRFLGKTQK